MTVSLDREFAEMEDKLEDLLAVLPESKQYFLIFCTDQEFKLVGLRRLAALAEKSTRMSRLSIFHMDMRTSHQVGAAVAPHPQASEPALVPKGKRKTPRKTAGSVRVSDPQPSEPSLGGRRAALEAGVADASDSQTQGVEPVDSLVPVHPSNLPQPGGTSIGKSVRCAALHPHCFPCFPNCHHLPKLIRNHLVVGRLFRI